MIFDEFSPSRTRRTLTAGGRTLRALGLDGPLTGVLAIIVCIGILVVYSASGQNWKMVEHHLVNIGIAVTALLALDVIHGVVLGQHALALTLMAAWATHLRLRLRVFSILSQCLTIFALLTGYQFVLFWVDGATGNPVTTFGRWLAPVIGALLWPLLVGALSRLHER